MEKDRHIGNGIWLSDVSDYGIENNRVDYKALAKGVGSMVLANTFVDTVMNTEYDVFEIVSGSFYDYFDIDGNEMTQDEYENSDYGDYQYKEFFQYYIVDRHALWVLEQFDEAVMYLEKYDLYVWCIDHYGTGWDYVLTDVKIDDDKE